MLPYTKQQVLSIVLQMDDEQRNVWINKHTDAEIIEISRMIIEAMEEVPEARNDKNFVDKTTNLKIDLGLMENELIDQQVQDMLREVEFQANMKEADEAYQNLRTALKQQIMQNPSDETSIEIARKIIIAEKENEDYYDDENWKEILHLLK